MNSKIQKKLIKEIIEIIGKEKIIEYHKKSIFPTIVSLTHIYISLIISFIFIYYLDRYVNFIFFLILGLLLQIFISTRISALNVLVHEGSHYNISDHKKLNDTITNWFIGACILYDVDMYKSTHLKHHSFLGGALDPDYSLYAPKTIYNFKKDILSDIFLITTFKRARSYLTYKSPSSKKIKNNFKHYYRKLFINSIIFGFFLFFFIPLKAILYYSVFWIIPLMCFFPIIVRFRTLVEHYFDKKDEAMFVARTTITSHLGHYFIGSKMEYHFQHHLFPNIPYHNLKKLHNTMTDLDYFNKSKYLTQTDNLSGGYYIFFKKYKEKKKLKYKINLKSSH